MKTNFKPQFDSIVFDLDGTLWDTCETCAVAWNNVVERLDITFRKITAEDVRRVTGKPHEECIRQTFIGLSENQIMAISEASMLEDNVMVERSGGLIYPGVREGLEKLHKKYRLFIVSNCQSGYIETFLRFSNFAKYFEDFECWGNTGKPKSENLQSIIARNKLQKPVMVGDAEGDQKAAKDCGVFFMFAKYGFGQCQKPYFSFNSFDELKSYLLP